MKRTLISLALIASLAACNNAGRQFDDCLSFLYAYMPLPDSVDYPRSFWEMNVEVSLLAKAEMPWGRTVPDREWRHFVLPVRVNNENLDTSRVVFYRELKERVSSLSMHDAALEVNHWCHEYVTYQPSDGRTSAPLATLRSGIGRCGEESTFCVAALRSVGIPARQVYTPRWAHTDDNHAWVEVWIDGEWHFMGACEPDAVLDRGWFNQPASRAMLMHTKVFGCYDGPEEVVSQTACYTEIHVTSNYAPVSLLQVLVTDSVGAPVPGASVDFRLYNYAEFYRLCTKQTDEEGRTSLTCGRGDLIVWARSDEGLLGFAKATVGTDEEVHITLSAPASLCSTYDFDIVPPAPHDNVPHTTPEQDAANKQRLAYEDSLRSARPMPQIPDGHPLSDLLKRARANGEVLMQFLDEAPDSTVATELLRAVSAKDLRDVTLPVLLDHATYAASGSGDVWRRYVLSPRVSNELLTPWRQELTARFGGSSVADVLSFVRDSLTIDDTRNPLHYCMSPLGVLHHRTTDAHSRDIFLVAALRAAGIPARIDETTGKVQWIEPGSPDSAFSEYVDDAAGSETLSKGQLELTASDPQPRYYTHFTLSYVRSDGSLQLLENEGESMQYNFQAGGRSYDTGLYVLVTGQRLASGAVLSRMTIFPLEAGQTVSVPVVIRHETEQVQVIGSFNSETRYLPMNETSQRSLLSETGRGYYVVGFLTPGHEPSNHALRDLSAARAELEAWGRPIVLLLPPGADLPALLRQPEYRDLPSTVHFGRLEAPKASLPLFMIADTFNRVVFRSEGYTIGLGKQIVDVAKKLD